MDSLTNEGEGASALPLHKKTEKRWGDMFFSFEYHVYWKPKSYCSEFFEDENYGIFEPKSWWNMMLIDYWKNLVLIFLRMGNTVFFSQKIHRKMILTWPFWAFSMIFQHLGNMVFPAVFPLISKFGIKRISSFLARFLER